MLLLRGTLATLSCCLKGHIGNRSAFIAHIGFSCLVLLSFSFLLFFLFCFLWCDRATGLDTYPCRLLMPARTVLAGPPFRRGRGAVFASQCGLLTSSSSSLPTSFFGFLVWFQNRPKLLPCRDASSSGCFGWYSFLFVVVAFISFCCFSYCFLCSSAAPYHCLFGTGSRPRRMCK